MKFIIFSVFFVVAAQLSFGQKENFLTKKEVKEGWILLFNGTNTEGWTTSGGKTCSGWLGGERWLHYCCKRR